MKRKLGSHVFFDRFRMSSPLYALPYLGCVVFILISVAACSVPTSTELYSGTVAAPSAKTMTALISTDGSTITR